MSENRGLASQITEYLWRKWNPPESVFLVKREVVDCVAGMIDLAVPLDPLRPLRVAEGYEDYPLYGIRSSASVRRSERLDIAKRILPGCVVVAPDMKGQAAWAAERALIYADALLAELDKP